MQWFKKHPEILRKESTSLSNNSNYKEIYQARKKLFLSHGSIIVRLGNTLYYPILIVYTDATPYSLPLIFPLNVELKIEKIEQLARLTIAELCNSIKSHVKFYANLRHQNASGELCVLERENLEDGGGYYGINTIIKRVRDWYAAHTTGNYPLDSEEVSFFSHFNSPNKELKILLPEFFFDSKYLEGDCYATHFSNVNFGNNKRLVYIGSYIDGLNLSGLFIDNNELVPKFNDNEIQTAFDIYNKKDRISYLIKEEKILFANWFQIDHEPTPFQNFQELIAIIGNGNVDFGIKRLSKARLGQSRDLPDFFYLGIRFPNRKGSLEFQIFKILRIPNTTYIMGSNNAERIINLIKVYGVVEAIEGEKFTEATYFQRNSTRADYSILKNINLNILGVGAIGSEVADIMAKAGVVNISLFDSQTMNAHNPIRHIAGLDEMGEWKVNSVKRILQIHNPFATILPFPVNLMYFELSLFECINTESISICSIADDNVEGYINQQLVLINHKAYYIRALRGGKTSRIFRVVPGVDACFYCLSLYRIEKRAFVEIAEDPLYPTLKNECSNPIRPASAADLKLISALASQIIINDIQADKTGDANHWIWSTDILENAPEQLPYKLQSQFIAPHKDCIYCSIDKKAKVTIDTNVLTYMQKLVYEDKGIETGGVLAGLIKANGDIHISKASPPGPKAIKEFTKFEKDIEFCQKFLDELYLYSNQQTVYVGEWHSHPNKNNKPSGTDLKSLTEIANEENYLLEQPVMIIFSSDGVPSCTLHPLSKMFYEVELEIMD